MPEVFLQHEVWFGRKKTRFRRVPAGSGAAATLDPFEALDLEEETSTWNQRGPHTLQNLKPAVSGKDVELSEDHHRQFEVVAETAVPQIGAAVRARSLLLGGALLRIPDRRG